ncbi:MAG TPA: 3-hydroxyacyl-CoA dehydrogenase [Clostridia bacterium]|nr:3-hydroxyacyl-CoA dehydrogenase [Clostridia bacterium]
MDIKDVKAIVTGGASGLGEAVVRKLVSQGARVAILDLQEEPGKRLAGGSGENAIFVRTDVTDERSVQGALATAIESFGSINTVVNCAGIGVAQKVLGKRGIMPLETFGKVVQVNLVGTFNVIRLAADKMASNHPNAEGERGVIINTSSVAAYEGQIGQVAYSASKGGIVGMILPLAREFAEYGIRVMGIAPGIFETPMFAGIPEKVRDALGKMVPFPSRLGKPEEFALMVQDIIENPVLNGTTIRLDGALRLQPR